MLICLVIAWQFGQEGWDDCGYILAGIGLALNHLAHLITMMVMRWRHAGQVCSGDFVEDKSTCPGYFDPEEPYLASGTFIFWAIMSNFILMVAAGLGTMIYIGITQSF